MIQVNLLLLLLLLALPMMMTTIPSNIVHVTRCLFVCVCALCLCQSQTIRLLEMLTCI